MSDGATRRCGGWKFEGHEGREPHECPRSEFGRGKGKRDGLQNKCRACACAYSKARDATPDRKAYVAAYNATPKGKAASAKRKAMSWAKDFLKVKDRSTREQCGRRKRPYDALYLNEVVDYIASCGPFPRCAYCQRDLCLERGRGVNNADSMSFDEVFPVKGVVPGNVAVVCSLCNSAKHHHDSRTLARLLHPDVLARLVDYEVRARKIMGLPEGWFQEQEQEAAEEAA